MQISTATSHPFILIKNVTHSSTHKEDSDQLILLVAGANSSGKSCCARYLASVLNDVTIVEFGDMVRAQMATDSSLAGDPTEAYEQLFRRHGAVMLVRWARSVINRFGETKTLIMVGVRDEPSYRKLIDAFPTIIRIAIVANPEVRRVRDVLKQADGVPTPVLSARAFATRDDVHRAWGLDTILNEADYTVFNNGSREGFEKELDRLLAPLTGRRHARKIRPT